MKPLTERLSRLSLAAAIAIIPVLSAGTSMAASDLCYRGVNLSGAEYGERGGVAGTNYTYPSAETVKYFAGKGMNVIRLPFKWERIQPALNQPLDPDELQRLKDTVALIRKSGMAVVLDPHNFGYYDKTQMMKPPATDLAFGDLWARLAVEFANEDGVAFGLMNEPHDIKAPDWLTLTNTAIRSIRTVGARNLILVPGTIWTGAWTWSDDKLGGGSNASVMIGVKDPLDFYAYEFHQYLDSDSSGTHATCEGADQAVKGIADVSDWLRQNKKRGFLGEFGAGGNDDCLKGLKRVLDTMNANRDAWLGWTYWSGGEWWPPEEPLNVQPRDGHDKPQMKVLTAGLSRKSTPAPACTLVKPAT